MNPDFFKKKEISAGLRCALNVSAAFFLLTAGLEARADFLEKEADYYQKDEIAGHAHRAYAERIYPWPEHPSRKVILKTNNLGFREDQDTALEKAEGVTRILVGGDSHTDGVVNNRESFPNLLENLLNESQRSGYEVLNGGVGHYGFQNYAGFLKKHLSLKPDVYMVAVYTGNDFLDMARFLEENGTPAKRPEDYEKILHSQIEDGAAALSQSLNQVYYFRAFPEMKEKVLEAAAGVFAEIQSECDSRNILFWVVLLPAKADVEWASDRSVLDAVKKGLKLTPEDLAINEELKESLKAFLAAKGIPYLDLADAMKGQKEALFWKRDHHLNDRGHRLTAERIYQAIGTEFPAQTTAG